MPRNQVNFETEKSRERIATIIAVLRENGSASTRDLEAATGVSDRNLSRFLIHLCKTGRIEVLIEAKTGRGHNAPAVYSLPVVDDDSDALPVTRRVVAANDWPRGEHAGRSGLVAVLFPLQRECAPEAA